ncbi:hypothetical protein QBC35DRAFT_512245 [Podospora australis]|uniref:Zn(2)-C6 fungal-type domain-containing protein n=1 Tax=Podospora australis TaxID=1536484 RepID=A0AAN6X1Z2_9PEZI|nr:hypothetical protein QBC35DRAFT_512245 [Podospora australis]
MASSHSVHSSSQDAHEKPHHVIQHHLKSNAVSGWTMSRLSQCFANPFMCPPSDVDESPPPAYQAIPSPFDCCPSTTQAMLDTGPSSFNQAQTYLPSISEHNTSNQVGMPACNDVEWQRMTVRYPPLQPDRVVGFQPHTGKEEMIYPSPPAYGIATQPYTTSPSIKSETASATYFGSAGGQTSPYEHHHDGFPNVPMPGQFQQFQGYGSGESGDSHMEVQAGSMVLAPHKGPSKRKAFSDPELRAKTAQTRKLGSCIRCRMQRIRCILDEDNEDGPCIPCKRSMGNSKVPRFHCTRRKIPDVKLYKPGQVPGFEWTKRWKGSVVDDIDTWVQTSKRTFLYVTEGYTKTPVKLLVREFVPQEGDKLERTWVDGLGVKRKLAIAPLAIADMEDAKKCFNDYITSQGCLRDCCENLMGKKDLLLRTYFVAIRKAFPPWLGATDTLPPEQSLLRKTLTLWMSIRLTTKSFKIVGNDNLGMPHSIINDPTQELDGEAPIPPVMGAQIDMILIHEIQPKLRRVVLDELQKMVLEKKKTTWFTTYLVSFILLHNLALITDHDARYAVKHGMNRRFARDNEVRDYNSSATTLLAYFHYVNRGVYPFSDECKDMDLDNLAELDQEAVELVRYSRQFAAKQKSEWERLWAASSYENEYYYLSQLFEQDWTAKPWEGA